jgi:hypothetical protein
MDGGVTFDLHGVWGTAAGGTHAVGDGPTILYSPGNGSWTWLPTGLPPTTLYAVWGSSASDVYVVGKGGTILHLP